MTSERCFCAECRSLDTLPAELQGWPGAYQFMLFAPKVFDRTWFWKSKLGDRKGQPCRIVARGAMNSIDVEFPDGFRVITSRYAVRKAASAG